MAGPIRECRECGGPVHGLRAGFTCNTCRGRQYRARALANDPDAFRDKNARRAAERAARLKSEDGDAYRAEIRRANLRRMFGITPEQYDAQEAAQDGVCAICGRPETAIDPRTGRTLRLAVDHDHETGALRGLLCGNCNRVLGKVGDDVVILARAIAYLSAGGRWTT